MRISTLLGSVCVFLGIISGAYSLEAQAVVWTEPAFPSQFDDITLYYDASEGNGALENYGGSIYGHMGLITNASSSGTDWKHVIGNWGTPDAQTLMTDEGNNIYSKSYNIQDFHNVPGGIEVLQLAFVFRNADGSLVGRDEDGSDIYYDVYPDSGSLFADVISPNSDLISLGDSIQFILNVSDDANVTVEDNGGVVYFESDTKSISFCFTPSTEGKHDVLFLVESESDTLMMEASYFVMNNTSLVEDPPNNIKNGINYFSDSTYIFQLTAPLKEFVFFLCPENEFELSMDFLMNRSEDGTLFWIELPKSYFDNNRNLYQYFVDGQLKIADPFSIVVLDENGDKSGDFEVASEVLDELPPFPEGLTSGFISVFDLENEPYEWQINDFQKPDNSNLVIYEVHIRDFVEDYSFKTLIDSLSYFEDMGVNAIELMPVNEFEWNNSWGYNTSFQMAVDKVYGSRDDFRAFVDEAHKRGIAVIVDIVFNHVFGQSPLAKMWWDDTKNAPSAESPYLNTVAKHPFNVGSDVNHESPFTKEWVKQVLEYWIENYRVDGFRFDLAKGFTQFDSGDDVGLMGKYDQSRINILQDYADHAWSVDPETYIILEHFAENNEEKVLANHGIMMWTNMNHEINEATMGYASDLNWMDYKERVWLKNNVVAYMESHDEERLMYRNSVWGNIEGDHNTKELKTAMRRVEAASALFYCLPGSRMLWQFGELGYDNSLFDCFDGTFDESCKLDPKPIRWDFLEDEDRSRLREVTKALIHLKMNYPTFTTDDYTFYNGNFYLKSLTLEHEEMDAVVMANFRTAEAELNPKFSKEGTWYEYFTGDSLVVTNTQEKINFYPGEYRVYLSKPITPPGGTFTGTEETHVGHLTVYPNPLNVNHELHILLPNNAPIDQLKLIDMQGRSHGLSYNQDSDILEVNLAQDLMDGMYVIQIWSGGKLFVAKLIK